MRVTENVDPPISAGKPLRRNNEGTIWECFWGDGARTRRRHANQPTQWRAISHDFVRSGHPLCHPLLAHRSNQNGKDEPSSRERGRKRERPTWKNVLRLLGRRKCDDNRRKQMDINGMLPPTTDLETGDHDKAVETQSNHKDQGPRSRDRRAQLVFLHLRRYAVGHAGITPDTRISAKDGRIIAAHHGLVRGGRSIAMEGSIGRPSASS